MIEINNMITKRPSRKQIVILISKDNTKIIGSNTNFHINFINRFLKEVNSNMLADFIYTEKLFIIITINQVVFSQDISIIEKNLRTSIEILFKVLIYFNLSHI